MIESIVVCNDASYNAPQTITALKPLNFIYGANGSGKTTISRIIEETSAYPRASIQWKDARPVETLVYNVDFVRKTFVTQMRGIFTLGEESADILEKNRSRQSAGFRLLECYRELAEQSRTR